MRYFAFIGNEGVIVRAVNDASELQRPDEWREVLDMPRHANANGLQALDAGKRMVFTQQDQSYPQLAALFA